MDLPLKPKDCVKLRWQDENKKVGSIITKKSVSKVL